MGLYAKKGRNTKWSSTFCHCGHLNGHSKNSVSPGRYHVGVFILYPPCLAQFWALVAIPFCPGQNPTSWKTRFASVPRTKSHDSVTSMTLISHSSRGVTRLVPSETTRLGSLMPSLWPGLRGSQTDQEWSLATDRIPWRTEQRR